MSEVLEVWCDARSVTKLPATSDCSRAVCDLGLQFCSWIKAQVMDAC